MKIAILGYGRMGRTIEGIAEKKGHEIVLKIGKDNTEDLTKENLTQADVAIDFSLPSTAFDNITFCIECGIPVVSGTTGWLEKYDTVTELTSKKNGAFFYASNFSIGVNIFREINERLAQLMNTQADYEPSLSEIHHIHKLDAPSGTAITLAEDLLKHYKGKQGYALGEEAQEHNLKIEAFREGEVPGTHIISYESKVDTLTIKHEAKGREGFASGAVIAAEWLIGKQGVFGMRDLLNL